MKRNAVLAVFSLLLAGGAAEANAKGGQSPLIQSIAGCRSQAEDAARLRCYDQTAGALVDATAQGTVVVLDQEDAKETRRSLFGFRLPKLPLFAGDQSAAGEQDEITAKVSSVRKLPHGRWQMKIEDGAVWETTETSSSVSDPDRGTMVVIKRGPLGSYMIRIGGQRALRAKRIS